MNEHLLRFVGSTSDQWSRITVVATEVHRDSAAWNDGVWRQTEALLSRPGWDLVVVPTQYELRGRYSGLREWNGISLAITRHIERAGSHKDGGRDLAILTSDVPFIGVAVPPNAPRLHVVHTMCALQAPSDAEWKTWEAENYGTWTNRRGRIAVPSRFLGTRLANSWPNVEPLVTVWRNGFFRSETLPLPIPLGPRLSVLAYGRALPSKGLHLAVAAVDALNARGLAVRLTLVAVPEPAEAVYFERLRRLANASDATEFIGGHVDAIAPMIGKATNGAVVIPSVNEPAGLGPLETYRWGNGAVPVVFDSGGLPESVDSSTGVVAPIVGVESLAEAIATAVGFSPESRRCKVAAGRRRLIHDYDFDRNAKRALSANRLV